MHSESEKMRELIMENIRVLMAAALLATAGCTGVGDLEIYKDRPIEFSHKTHLEEAELSCTECHTGAEDADQAGMPSPGTCRLCHTEKEDIKEKLQPFVVEGELMWTSVTELAEELTFSHKIHHEGGVACAECHAGIEKSEKVSRRLALSKDDCFSCHADRDLSARECETCHQEINRDWKPENHEHNWERYHGQVVRSGLEPPYTNRCSLCHQESTCSSCHQEEAPGSHNAYWRLRGHAINARMDRESCATCHRIDYCDRCHRDTRPRNHAGSWGEPGNRHCLTCHFPLEQQMQGCATCHKVMPGHMNATPLPDTVTHQTASESACRTCHIGLGTLPHPDNGDSCRSCHR